MSSSKTTTRKVSLSPITNKKTKTKNSKENDDTKCFDSKSKLLLFVPNSKSWDRKRKGYGSKKFSHGRSSSSAAAGYNISPIVVLDHHGIMEEVSENVGRGWGTSILFSSLSLSSSSSSYDYHNARNFLSSMKKTEDEMGKGEALSVINDDLSSNNDDDDDSFSPTATGSLNNNSVAQQRTRSSSYEDGEKGNAHHSPKQPEINPFPDTIQVETLTDDDIDG